MHLLLYFLTPQTSLYTGDNGTIDGQGSIWWNWFQKKTLNYTRPHLVEFINSTGVVISNVTFLNSPFWTIHPVYCSQVIIQNVTILAPLDSPNTDGIDPDSSNDVCIEDCYISTGDDLIAIKSGWDEYGISYARPSTNIIIRRLVGKTTQVQGLQLGVRCLEVYQKFMQKASSSSIQRQIAIRFTGQYGEHPDEFYDPTALPIIENITNLHGTVLIFTDILTWFHQRLVNLWERESTLGMSWTVTIFLLTYGA
ncbi:putative polygalacturonase [Vitis vinifera]|uniref:Putative polygalacturonase n=1 Tax=Vitis vinifera TaxID=29760 RepID=A0A438C9U4_VITVI|nr:putative polygalacturonase [Vitis vinifera]